MKNLNRLFFPALIPEPELWQLVGLSHQALWDFSARYTEGFLAEGGPNGVRRYELIFNLKYYIILFASIEILH